MRATRWRCATALLPGLLLAGGPRAADAQVWSYSRLDLNVAIDPVHERLDITGTGVVTLADAAADEIRLFVNTRSAAIALGHVTTTNRTSTVSIESSGHQQLVHIALESPAEPGDSVRFEFTSTLSAPSSQLLLTAEVALASWVEAWYPVPSGPAGARWAAPGTTRFHVPAGWHAVTNGTLISTTIRGDSAVHVWHTTEAVHRSFAAAQYRAARTSAGGRDIAVYLLTADSASARRQAETLARAITAMERVWGRYPYDGYAIAEVPTDAVAWAASAEQGFIMAVSSQFGDDGNLPLFAHEAAHAWWGNRVSSTGPGARMVTEALAQYGAVIAIEALEGTDAMNEFLRFSRRGYNRFQSAHGYFEIVRRGGDKPLSLLGNDTWDHNLSDSKGHWFYHMLRHRLGSERFFAILRDVQNQYTGRALSLADLRGIFVDAAPDDPGLEEFVAQWLDRTTAPHFAVDWWTTDEGHGARIVVTQVQDDLYDLELDIELTLASGHRVRRTLHVAERMHEYTLSAHGRIVDLRLDPDHILLFWRPEYGQPIGGHLQGTGGATAAPILRPGGASPRGTTLPRSRRCRSCWRSSR